MLEFYILTFGSSNQVIKSEIALENIKGIRIIPLYPEISAGCGLSLKIPKENFLEAMNILEQESITPDAIYFRDEDKRIKKI